MTGTKGKILILTAFLLLSAACQMKNVFTGDGGEVLLQLELPEPLSSREVGIEVGPGASSEIQGGVSIDVGSVSDNLDDVAGIVIAIIPAVIHFDTLGTFSSPLPLEGDPVLQHEEKILVWLYLAPAGEEDPFQDIYLGAEFLLEVSGTEITHVSDPVTVPIGPRGTILSGHATVGVRIESTVRGRLSIESADLVFHL